MTDISVIILLGKEELHIQRCLEKLNPLHPREVFVIESQKGDNTHSLAISTARSLGWHVNDLTRTRPDAVVPSNSTESAPRKQLQLRAEKDAETRKFLQWSDVRKSANADAEHGNRRMSAGPLQNTGASSCGIRSDHCVCVLNLIFHDWPGLQSTQFNWALDNLPLEGAWVLRLDADEYLTDEGIAWLKENLDTVFAQYDLLEFTLERKFCGGTIRHGTNGIPMVRMFRRGTARYAEGLMDERLIPIRNPQPLQTKGDNSTVHLHLSPSPSTLSVPIIFYDDSLMPMSEWRTKHRGYAKREAQQVIESMKSGNWTNPRKAKYYRLPPYLRAFAYFAIRYFLKGGFLDGYAGWMWNFWQGLWYRCLVDYEIGKLRKHKSVGMSHITISDGGAK